MAKGLTPEQTRVLDAMRAEPGNTFTAWALQAHVRTLFSLERHGLVYRHHERIATQKRDGIYWVAQGESNG